MEHEFTGRRPSKAMIKKKLTEMMATGYPVVAVTWGENWIEARKDARGFYYGNGHIMPVFGYDIVNEITH